MRPKDVEKLPPYSGLVEGPNVSGNKLPYDQLVEELKQDRFMDRQDPQYYHVHTFWATWRDEEFGSNQAVFHSLKELCDWIEECGGFAADDLFVVEEISSIYRR